MPDHRPPFRVVICGVGIDPELLHRKLDVLLARKLRTHTVEVLCPDGGLGLAVALWAERNGVGCGPYGPPTAYDEKAVARNSSLLKDANAFIGVGPRKD